MVVWSADADANAAAKDALSAVDAVAEAVRRMGRLDTFIANAGVGQRARSFLEMPVDGYRRTLTVNLDGAVWCVREACR